MIFLESKISSFEQKIQNVVFVAWNSKEDIIFYAFPYVCNLYCSQHQQQISIMIPNVAEQVLIIWLSLLYFGMRMPYRMPGTLQLHKNYRYRVLNSFTNSHTGNTFYLSRVHSVGYHGRIEKNLISTGNVTHKQNAGTKQNNFQTNKPPCVTWKSFNEIILKFKNHLLTFVF